jgi:CheY-like chemotaxis protein
VPSPVAQPAARPARERIKVEAQAKPAAAGDGSGDESVVIDSQADKTVTITVTVTTGATTGERSSNRIGPVQKSVVLEWPSGTDPNLVTLTEEGRARGGRAEVSGRAEGGADRLAGHDHPAQAASVRQAQLEKLAGLDGAAGEPAGEAGPRKKVLLIEDDSTIRMLLQMGLRKHHFDCVIAENGRAAQSLLHSTRPDLIVVDLLMPVMDGMAFIQWLRQTAQDSTPVLVFTTVDDPKITQDVLRSGADFLARKPLHLKELVEAMNRLIRLPRREPKPAST